MVLVEVVSIHKFSVLEYTSAIAQMTMYTTPSVDEAQQR